MLPNHEMFEGNVTNDSNVVMCFTNAEDGTAEGDLSVYLKDNNQWQLNLGEHLPRFELQEAYNDLKPCPQSIIWWVVVAGDWYYFLFLERGCDTGRRGYWYPLGSQELCRRIWASKSQDSYY